jgi:hypothetical protein
MALRRVATGRSTLNTPVTWTTGLSTANQMVRNAVVEMPSPTFEASETTAAQNPFGFNYYQLQNGFQAANTIGRQYGEFDEAPMGYISEHPVFGSDFGSSYNFDTMFGMLGSLIGPHVRQALETPIVHRDPITGSVVSGDNSVDINVGIDWALGEKQATFGTPEYFRSLYYDSLPTSPGAYALGLALTSPSAYRDSQRTYQNKYGTPISYKDPTAAANVALSGGYQDGVVTRVEQGDRGGMYDVHNLAYKDPHAAAIFKESRYRPNEFYLGTGTGDFRGPQISTRAAPTIRGAYETAPARSPFQPEAHWERAQRSFDASMGRSTPTWSSQASYVSGSPTTGTSIQNALSHSWNYSANPDIGSIRRWW